MGLFGWKKKEEEARSALKEPELPKAPDLEPGLDKYITIERWKELAREQQFMWIRQTFDLEDKRPNSVCAGINEAIKLLKTVNTNPFIFIISSFSVEERRMCDDYRDFFDNIHYIAYQMRDEDLPIYTKKDLDGEKSFYKNVSFYLRKDKEFEVLADLCEVLTDPLERESEYGYGNEDIICIDTLYADEAKTIFKPTGDNDYDDIKSLDIFDAIPSLKDEMLSTIRGCRKYFELLKEENI